MGNPKQKWTAEEEEALLAGVGKYGQGKWQAIIRDPEFSDQLIDRNNVDLKDKWRNLCVIQGSKDKIRTPRIKAAAFHLANISAATTATNSVNNSSPVARCGSSDNNSCDIVVEPKNTPKHDGMIYKALSALGDDDGNGCDVNAILNFIKEERYEMPQDFRKTLGSRLRRLALQGKLVRFGNLFRLNDNSLPLVARIKEMNVKPRQTQRPTTVTTTTVAQEKLWQASITAAVKVKEVENSLDVVKGATEEFERMTKLAEDAERILLIAQEMHQECSLGKIWELN